MKTIKICILALLANSAAVAQLANLQGTANNVIRETTYTTTEGSPYYYPDFKGGTMTTKNKTYSDEVYIRYDCYKDQVEFQRDGAELIASAMEVTGFSFHAFDQEAAALEDVFRNGFKVNGYSVQAYFNVIYDGRTKFLKKYSVDQVDVPSNSYGNTNGVKRFDRKNREFVLFENGKSVELKGNRKALLDGTGTHKEAISKFIKDNKLNLKEDKDLISVLKKIDELGV